MGGAGGQDAGVGEARVLAALDRRARGDAAESRCVAWLEAAGYRVLARNWRVREGELDIVAEHGGTLCFVEVRMRTSATFGDPAMTVGFEKQRRVRRAALRYLQAHPARRRAIRFDVMTVLGTGERAQVEHLPGAFDAGM